MGVDGDIHSQHAKKKAYDQEMNLMMGGYEELLAKQNAPPLNHKHRKPEGRVPRDHTGLLPFASWRPGELMVDPALEGVRPEILESFGVVVVPPPSPPAMDRFKKYRNPQSAILGMTVRNAHLQAGILPNKPSKPPRGRKILQHGAPTGSHKLL